MNDDIQQMEEPCEMTLGDHIRNLANEADRQEKQLQEQSEIIAKLTKKLNEYAKQQKGSR